MTDNTKVTKEEVKPVEAKKPDTVVDNPQEKVDEFTPEQLKKASLEGVVEDLESLYMMDYSPQENKEKLQTIVEEIKKHIV